ncbi:MAG: hypothetical protein M3R61_10405 [Chloroflexota bacterium]|nr:hypothetical protein [Chloroflexota bacterium]
MAAAWSRAPRTGGRGRLTGAGRPWEERNVNPLRALRKACWHERWDETWPVIAQASRRHVLIRRQHRRAARAPSFPARLPRLPAATTLVAPILGAPVTGEASTPLAVGLERPSPARGGRCA